MANVSSLSKTLTPDFPPPSPPVPPWKIPGVLGDSVNAQGTGKELSYGATQGGPSLRYFHECCSFLSFLLFSMT